MIYFSSDFHLNHSNIAGPTVSNWDKGYRDFKNVSEMNETILKNINDTVKYDDVLYYLGDFCFKNHKDTPNWRNRINCQTIHLCKGNHDSHVDKYKDSFASVQDVIYLTIPPYNFFLSHYAHRVWMGSHKGYIHLYGHSHDTIPDHGKSMDVGIDVAYRLFGEYRPFSFEEIIQIMNKKEIKFVDGHNKDTNIK